MGVSRLIPHVVLRFPWLGNRSMRSMRRFQDQRKNYIDTLFNKDSMISIEVPFVFPFPRGSSTCSPCRKPHFCLFFVHQKGRTFQTPQSTPPACLDQDLFYAPSQTTKKPSLNESQLEEVEMLRCSACENRGGEGEKKRKKQAVFHPISPQAWVFRSLGRSS